jgi:hypothetical protein
MTLICPSTKRYLVYRQFAKNVPAGFAVSNGLYSLHGVLTEMVCLWQLCECLPILKLCITPVASHPELYAHTLLFMEQNQLIPTIFRAGATTADIQQAIWAFCELCNPDLLELHYLTKWF